MTKWIANLFNKKGNPCDIVRFVRTEYHADTQHLADDDCVRYYNNLMSKKRRA